MLDLIYKIRTWTIPYVSSADLIQVRIQHHHGCELGNISLIVFLLEYYAKLNETQFLEFWF